MRASLSTRGFERQIGRWTKLLVALLLIWVQQAHSQTAHAPLTSNLTLTTDILAQRISFESVDDLQGVSGPVALSSRHFKDGFAFRVVVRPCSGQAVRPAESSRL